MKNKILVVIAFIVLIILTNFVLFIVNDGFALADPPSLSQRLSDAISHPIWLNPLTGFIVLLLHPFLMLLFIVFIVVFYFIYDNYFVDKKKISSGAFSEKIEFANTNSSRRSFKKFVLWGTFFMTIYVIFISWAFSGPGEGMGVLIFLSPAIPIIGIFYPVYFIILSVRYSKEKSYMDPLDKIMFYILAVPIISLGSFAVYKVYSGNVIQALLDSRKQEIEERSVQIDLVAENISFDVTGNLKLEFCNDSKNSPNFYTKHFSMKVETDKNTEFTFEPIIFPPESGKCDARYLPIEKIGLSKGDGANITFIIDPENKVNETNKENNKMTKSIVLNDEAFKNQAAKVDLFVKDIYFNISSQLDVKFCNNSENLGADYFSINVDTDKKSNFTFKSVTVPGPNKCSDRVLEVDKLGSIKGDVANITVSLDSENKINETNKENNKVTQEIIFGKKQGECFDTDGGRNYYLQGQATILTKNEGNSDCCRESFAAGPCLSQSQHLIESYCEGGKPLAELYKCPNGCVDGACVK